MAAVAGGAHCSSGIKTKIEDSHAGYNMQMQKTAFKLIKIVSVFCLLSGCVTLSPLVNLDAPVERVVQASGYKKAFIKTGYFVHTSYYYFGRPGEPINIYIEGDGRAWVNRAQSPDNPTPKSPLVLRLASMDPAANVAYLARPGQYTESGLPLCEAAYWSDKRFSKEVVASMNEAINQLCLKAKTDKINLIGYSGGAAIAVLVAAGRNDIVSLRTVAGNLDTGALIRYYRTGPLNGSLNPIDVAEKLKGLPQRHFVGAKDKIVPLFIAQSFVERAGDKDFSRITVIDGATHVKGWRQHWKEFLSYPVAP